MKFNEKKNPLVSIIITSYNRAYWLRQAIDSALRQDYSNLEIIITDNCSIDGSNEIIESYINDKRIRYSRNSVNIGMIANFEKGFFELAKGDYIMNLSSDDYLINDSFISDAVNLIKKHENIYLVFGRWISYFDDNKKTIPSPCAEYYGKEFRKGLDAFFEFEKYPYFGWGGCLLDRKILIKENLHFSGRTCGDIEINLNLMQLGNVSYVNKDTYVIRFHDHNATAKIPKADTYIDSRLNLFENLYNLYCKRFGADDRIKSWKKSMILADINNISISLMIRNKNEFNKFSQYVKYKYPDLYQQTLKRPKYLLGKYMVLPIIKNIFLKKAAAMLLPGKNIFKNNYINNCS